MNDEQKLTLEALEQAIKMEEDGRDYYTKASKNCSNKLGKELLKSLAEEEKEHEKAFKDIYKSFQKNLAWPDAKLSHVPGIQVKTVIAQLLEEQPVPAGNTDTELDAVKTAMELETRTRKFYNKRAESSACEEEQRFYRSLAEVERGHYMALSDYYEYLKDPAAWFVEKEHPSLDGG